MAKKKTNDMSPVFPDFGEPVKLTLFTEFSTEEKIDIANALSESIQKKNEIEDEKRNVTSELGGKIKEQENIANRLSKMLQEGGEDREVECQIRYNYPTKGKKTIHRTDTGELIEKDMEHEDYNLFTQK